MKDKYTGLSEEHLRAVFERYDDFVDRLADESKEPIRVFNPLSQPCKEGLEMIREVSKDLQKKKEEDIKKAAQAAAIHVAEEKKLEEKIETEEDKEE